MKDRLENVCRGDTLRLRCGGLIEVTNVYDEPYHYALKGYGGTFTWWNKDWSGTGRDGKYQTADPHPMDVVEVIKPKINKYTLTERLKNAFQSFKETDKR